MGEANEGNKRSLLEKLSLEPNRFPRDLLQRFMATNNNLREQEEAEEGSEEVELSLGLSLGGRFGVNKIVGGLVRSSSIASCLPVVRDDDAVAPPRASYPALIRTSSLPTETEEQWRKRKEMQTLRRMEAKRRRSEKQRNLKSDKEGGGSGSGGGGSERSFEDERAQFEVNLRGRDQNTGASNRIPLGLTSWAPATGGRQGCVSGGSGCPDGKPSGSVESQGGSSSISESAIRPNQGSNSCAEPDAASLRSLQERGSQEAIRSSSSKGKECACNPPPLNTQNPSTLKTQNPSNPVEKQGRRESSLEDMPCVFTMGDGPNGRRVDGILYKYGKGEEVRIMCVCHGRFLSPAEFVKHAGGTDVGNPLKHIVINPNASSLS